MTYFNVENACKLVIGFCYYLLVIGTCMKANSTENEHERLLDFVFTTAFLIAIWAILYGAGLFTLGAK